MEALKQEQAALTEMARTGSAHANTGESTLVDSSTKDGSSDQDTSFVTGQTVAEKATTESSDSVDFEERARTYADNMFELPWKQAAVAAGATATKTMADITPLDTDAGVMRKRSLRERLDTLVWMLMAQLSKQSKSSRKNQRK